MTGRHLAGAVLSSSAPSLAIPPLSCWAPPLQVNSMALDDDNMSVMTGASGLSSTGPSEVLGLLGRAPGLLAAPVNVGSQWTACTVPFQLAGSAALPPPACCQTPAAPLPRTPMYRHGGAGPVRLPHGELS